MFLHIQFVLHILLFCTFLYSIAHFTSYFFFLPIYIYSWVVLLLYNLIFILFFLFFYSLHCPLNGPDLTYISLLIIPCIIYHVTNKETLTLNCTLTQFNWTTRTHCTNTTYLLSLDTRDERVLHYLYLYLYLLTIWIICICICTRTGRGLTRKWAGFNLEVGPVVLKWAGL